MFLVWMTKAMLVNKAEQREVLWKDQRKQKAAPDVEDLVWNMHVGLSVTTSPSDAHS